MNNFTLEYEGGRDLFKNMQWESPCGLVLNIVLVSGVAVFQARSKKLINFNLIINLEHVHVTIGANTSIHPIK